MLPTSSPGLVYRGRDYWQTPEPATLADILRQRFDLHEWPIAANDRKAHKELVRFYHKPAGCRSRLPASGIVIEKDGWVRLVGEAPERARRVLEALQSGEAVEEVQSCLF